MRAPLVLLLALPLCGQTPPGLSLEDAVALALQQNPAVAAAQRAVEEADARIEEARADYFPHLGSSGLAKVGASGAMNEAEPVGLANSPFFRNFGQALHGRYLAYDSGRTKHAVGVERARRRAVEGDLRAVEASVILATERAFYGVLRAIRLRRAAAEIVRSREQTVRQARAFYEGRLRSRVDLDLAQFSLAQAQLRLVEAETAVRSAVADLGRALGASQDAEYELEPPDLPMPRPEPLPELIQEGYERRPELRALRAEREAAAESVQLARSRRKPLFSFAYSGGYARFTELVARQLLVGGVGLAFPLFTGGAMEGQIEQAEARLRLLDSRIEDGMQQVALETRNAYFELENALESLPVQNLQVEYARSAARLARVRYAEQLGTIVELTQAEAAVAQAEAEAVSAVYGVRTADAALRFAVGRR